MGMRLRFGERPCFVLCLNFSLMLWSHWSRQAPPAPPSHLKTWYLFLWSSGGGSCGSVSRYSSVKCCLWALDEQRVSAGRVSEIIERCSSIQILEGCCYIPPKPFLLHPGQVCFPQPFLTPGTISLVFCWTCSRWKFCVFWKPGEGVLNRGSVLLCAVRWVSCTDMTSVVII